MKHRVDHGEVGIVTDCREKIDSQREWNKTYHYLLSLAKVNSSNEGIKKIKGSNNFKRVFSQLKN